jgi:hypothetical protein
MPHPHEAELYPANWTEAKRALRSSRAGRSVYLYARVSPRRHIPGLTYDVVGPSGDEVLVVHVFSGMVPLRVLSGNVRITLASDSGNVVEVLPAARETTSVDVWTRCKVTATGVHPDHWTGDMSRVRQRDAVVAL